MSTQRGCGSLFSPGGNLGPGPGSRPCGEGGEGAVRLLPSPLPAAECSVRCAVSRSSLSGLPDLHECGHPWVNVYLRAQVHGPLETELCAVLKGNGQASRQPVAPLPIRGWPFPESSPFLCPRSAGHCVCEALTPAPPLCPLVCLSLFLPTRHCPDCRSVVLLKSGRVSPHTCLFSCRVALALADAWPCRVLDLVCRWLVRKSPEQS